MFDNIQVAFRGLGANKLRSALTMLGISIGVSVVIILVSLGQAVEHFVLDQFSMLGSDLVYVFGELENHWGQPTWLTQSDAEALADPYNVPDGLHAMPSMEFGATEGLTVVYANRDSVVNVLGTTPLYPDIMNQPLAAGRFFTDAEVTGGARVAVIGQTVVEDLFADVNPIIGQYVRIGNVRVQIIGILEDTGTASMGAGSDLNNVLLMPLTTAQDRLTGDRLVSGERPVTSIVIRAREESLVNAVAEQARQTLREQHDLRPGEDDNFSIMTQTDLMESVRSVTGVLTIFLGAIAGISLVVGGIGIMNIMLVTVTERTHEIGIRKAVGAQRFDIMAQFLTEAVVLALLGGAGGIGLAWLLTDALAGAMPDLAVSIRLSSILLATGVSVTIGVFFGIYPANRAAGLDPIDALRYE